MALAWTIPLIVKGITAVVKNRKDKNAQKRAVEAVKKERVPLDGVTGLLGYLVRMDLFKGVRKVGGGLTALVVGGASLLGLSDIAPILPELDVGRAVEMFALGLGLLGLRDR